MKHAIKIFGVALGPPTVLGIVLWVASLSEYYRYLGLFTLLWIVILIIMFIDGDI